MGSLIPIIDRSNLEMTCRNRAGTEQAPAGLDRAGTGGEWAGPQPALALRDLSLHREEPSREVGGNRRHQAGTVSASGLSKSGTDDSVKHDWGPRWHNFFPPHFFTFSTKSFFPQTPLSFPMSENTALTKTLTNPSTLWGHTLNAAARFMTYPKLWNGMWGKREGVWRKCAFVGKK